MIRRYIILYLEIKLKCLAMLSTYLITCSCCGCLHCRCLSFNDWILGPGYYRWSIKHIKNGYHWPIRGQFLSKFYGPDKKVMRALGLNSSELNH